jgi:hypothetical protein
MIARCRIAGTKDGMQKRSERQEPLSRQHFISDSLDPLRGDKLQGREVFFRHRPPPFLSKAVPKRAYTSPLRDDEKSSSDF